MVAGLNDVTRIRARSTRPASASTASSSATASATRSAAVVVGVAAVVLDLDVHAHALARGRAPRPASARRRERPSASSSTMHPAVGEHRVVVDDEGAVGRAAHVELDPVGAEVTGVAEGLERVLGPGGGRPTVTDHQGPGVQAHRHAPCRETHVIAKPGPRPLKRARGTTTFTTFQPHALAPSTRWHVIRFTIVGLSSIASPDSWRHRGPHRADAADPDVRP